MASSSVTLRWTQWDGTVTVVRETGHTDLDAAWQSVLSSARRAGWTPPRWWEVWRWHDTRPPINQAARAETAD